MPWHGKHPTWMPADQLIRAINTGEIRIKPNSDELRSKKGSLKKEFIHSLPVDMVTRGRPQLMLSWIRKNLPLRNV